jgi:hypothetical protein
VTIYVKRKFRVSTVAGAAPMLEYVANLDAGNLARVTTDAARRS